MQGLQGDTVTMETETTVRCSDYMEIQGLQGDTGTTGYRIENTGYSIMQRMHDARLILS